MEIDQTTADLKQAKTMVPAEGVKFVRYDEYGVPLAPDAETGFDY